MAHNAHVASVVDNDLYYSWLNVARTATPTELAEQFRALSLVFHPDKQPNEERRKIATKKFQELSKAYEVLSDPFLREIYDLRGEDGLKLIHSEQFKMMSRDEIRKALLDSPKLGRGSGDEQRAVGAVTLGIGASSLFCPYQGCKNDTLTRRILNRCEDVQVITFGLSRIFERSINAHTKALLKCQLSQQGRDHTMRQLVGTVRHQFSPRLMSELSIGLLPRFLKVSAEYEVEGTLLSSQVMSSYAQPTPTLKLSASRQLYYQRPEVASIELDITKNPRYTFKLKSLSNFGMQGTDARLLPSNSGLREGVSETSIGIAFRSILPTLVIEQTLNLTELALQLKINFDYTLYMGFEWICSGTWTPESQREVTLSTSLGFSGVSFSLNIIYEDSAFSVPLVLATEPNSTIGCCGVVFPAVLALLSYHFLLRPRRRRRRLECIRAARHELEESGERQRDRDATLDMLRLTARRSKEAEVIKGGLVIIEATWGLSDSEESNTKDFFVDVTVPLQALVRKSQLYIPCDRSKSDIRGFGDPAPFARKILCVRYLFHNRNHYAEIREDFPIVLPLAEHLAEP